MIRQQRIARYALAFSAGWFIAGTIGGYVVKSMEADKAKAKARYLELYGFCGTLVEIVEEKEPNLFNDPRMNKLLFDNIVKDI